MKQTNSLLRIGLVGLFLTFTAAVFAQTAPATVTPINSASDLDVGTINDDQTTVTANVDAVLFYNPSGTSITLNALETDLVTGLDYDEYTWHSINQDGSIAATEAETGRQLTINGLAPGYYRYRVYGFINDAGIICQSDEYQDIIFFVLPDLTAAAAPAAGALPALCITDDTSGQSLILNGTVNYNALVPFNSNSFVNPDVDDFALTYRWYAVNDEDPSVQIPLTTPATETNAGAASSITIDYDVLKASGAGTYTFHVEVEYSSAIKARGGREHAIWTAQVMNGTEAYKLQITPTPGRPTITIGSITD